MIRVISFFINSKEDNKLYRKGQIITHFTKKEENESIKRGHSERINK